MLPNAPYQIASLVAASTVLGRLAGQAAGSRSAIGLLVLRLTSPGIPDHDNGHELPYFRSSTTTPGVPSTGWAVQTMLG